jgi:hypothetical protein
VSNTRLQWINEGDIVLNFSMTTLSTNFLLIESLGFVGKTGHWKRIPPRSKNCLGRIFNAFSPYIHFLNTIMEARQASYKLIPANVNVVDRDLLDVVLL